MPKMFDLSETEMEVMEMIWQADKKLTFAEILEYFNTVKNKEWKKQTLQTFLVRLIDKGVLTADKQRSRYLYYPAVSKEGHITTWTKNFVDKTFCGSIKNFMVAFTGGEKLSDETIKELKEFLDQ